MLLPIVRQHAALHLSAQAVELAGQFDSQKERGGHLENRLRGYVKALKARWINSGVDDADGVAHRVNGFTHGKAIGWYVGVNGEARKESFVHFDTRGCL